MVIHSALRELYILECGDGNGSNKSTNVRMVLKGSEELSFVIKGPAAHMLVTSSRFKFI
jgi:hypothetical protein